MLCCLAGLGLASTASILALKRPSARAVFFSLALVIVALMTWHLLAGSGRMHSHANVSASDIDDVD